MIMWRYPVGATIVLILIIYRCRDFIADRPLLGLSLCAALLSLIIFGGYCKFRQPLD
jgi:hypothetical protein